eukprot:GSChrysophyteH1.ASY1.ANO1.1070.1 assembled CDS
MMMSLRFLCAVISLACVLRLTEAQYRDYTEKYKEVMRFENAKLTDTLYEINEDMIEHFKPEASLLFNDGFIYVYPTSEEFRIGLLIDPCRGHTDPWGCCMNVFGVPEYPAMKVTGHTQERVINYPVLGNETEVQINFVISYETGNAVPTFAQRSPDDEEVHDLKCEGPGVPFSYCAGKNYGFRKSQLLPACMDNNQSLNTLADCFEPDGTTSSNCVAVAYSQNAFIGLCADDSDPHCGTFLEVHQIEGTPYTFQTDVISEKRITTRQVSGYYTTTLPMTWFGNPRKVLCAYTEPFIRIGSIVYVKPVVPVCCCAKPFKPATRVGSIQCPIGPNGGGAFGSTTKNLAEDLSVDASFIGYPYCPTNLDSDEDRMVCSTYERLDMRHYVRACLPVTQTDPNVARSWSSDDLDGKEYDGLCPYYDSCALTLDDGKCKGEDLQFTFMGRVGRVTFVDDISLIPKVRVTFNDGRTSYLFNKDQVQKEYSLSMYEVWWVLRTKSEFVVQKRKGFNVTEPKCTFDIVNNRYFPYTVLDENMQPLDSATLAD